MQNPFDNDDGQFVVVKNAKGQHALWPTFASVPGGWLTVFGAASRQACLDWTDANWPDVVPKSVAESG